MFVFCACAVVMHGIAGFFGVHRLLSWHRSIVRTHVLFVCLYLLDIPSYHIYWRRGGMAAYLGQVGEFAEGSEDWTQYVERLGHFMAANGIEEVERKNVFPVV